MLWKKQKGQRAKSALEISILNKSIVFFWKLEYLELLRGENEQHIESVKGVRRAACRRSK